MLNFDFPKMIMFYIGSFGIWPSLVTNRIFHINTYSTNDKDTQNRSSGVL